MRKFEWKPVGSSEHHLETALGDYIADIIIYSDTWVVSGKSKRRPDGTPYYIEQCRDHYDCDADDVKAEMEQWLLSVAEEGTTNA